MKLISPKSYRKASRRLKKEICNGCGSSGYDYFVPDNLLGLSIKEA